VGFCEGGGVPTSPQPSPPPEGGAGEILKAIDLTTPLPLPTRCRYGGRGYRAFFSLVLFPLSKPARSVLFSNII
jgi:hypothetical protein